MSEQKAYAGWAIVELMGHVRIAGRISEEPMFGTALMRIDIPDGDSYTTQYVGGASIYRLTPCAEEIARAVVADGRPLPIEPWELRRLQQPREIPSDLRGSGPVEAIASFGPPRPVDREVLISSVGDEYLEDLLGLVFEELPDGWREWPQETKDQVATWCTAVHLVASDNDDVAVPPKPAVLAAGT